jgi:thioredoxin reductase
MSQAPETQSTNGPRSGDALDVDVDVVVVGGGAAGLAAAIALGRSRRSVVVVDAGQPRNAPAAGAHNVLGHEGIAPLELLARGRSEAEGYGVRILNGLVTGASGVVDDFVVEVDGGASRLKARRIVLATGLVDELPDIPGIREAWGRSVLHCPYCHGWEVRDRRIAVIGRTEMFLHQVMLFRQLSDDVTLFLHEAPEPTDEQWEQLAALGVGVVTPRVTRLVSDEADASQVRAVEIEGGRSFEVDAVVVAPRFVARTELYEALGGERTLTPFGEQVVADPRGMTAVPGVFVAGNTGEPMAMVAAAAGSGVMAGAAVNGDLVMADLARAVEVRARPFSAAHEARAARAVLGDRRHGV